VNKRYQKDKRVAAEKFQRWAQTNEEPIEVHFPSSEMMQLAEQGLGELLRRVGKLFMESVMEAEVEDLVGIRSKPNRQRDAFRWGTEHGYCVIDGQRVPIARPRVRSRQHNREIPLGSYELFQRASLIQETVWHKIMYGLSMRSYKEVVQQFADAYGLNKSTTSRHFIEASRIKLKQLMTRSLAHVSLCAMMIDGTIFKGEHLIVAIGIDRFGHKILLGIRQGATENATVVGELLEDLTTRGVNLTEPMLYVIDGSKAIHAAILSHAGDAAFIQRCQVHKIRNVTEHLPDGKRPAVKYRMRSAYQMNTAADARQALYRLHDDLMAINPSAAGSLAEGLEETLTVIELQITPRLRRSLSSTNGIESSFSIAERICGQVKRWQGSDHRLRWVGSALLFSESRWNRLTGYRHIPMLTSALKTNLQLRRQQQKTRLQHQINAA
jgi:putative transposase